MPRNISRKLVPPHLLPASQARLLLRNSVISMFSIAEPITFDLVTRCQRLSQPLAGSKPGPCPGPGLRLGLPGVPRAARCARQDHATDSAAPAGLDDGAVTRQRLPRLAWLSESNLSDSKLWPGGPGRARAAGPGLRPRAAARPDGGLGHRERSTLESVATWRPARGGSVLGRHPGRHGASGPRSVSASASGKFQVQVGPGDSKLVTPADLPVNCDWHKKNFLCEMEPGEKLKTMRETQSRWWQG